MTATPAPSRSIYPILTVNFIGTLGFSIVLPFLVYVVTDLGGNAFVYGVVGATYSFFQLIGAPLLGRWSDRFGRRRILLLSQGGTLVSWGILLAALLLPVTPMLEVDSAAFGAFTLTIPLVLVFAARAFDGLTGGNVSVANAYLADVTSEEDRSTNFGRMAMAANLGFIVGPALAGVLGATRWGPLLPVMAALAISAVACAFIALRLPESQPCVLGRKPETASVRTVLGPDQKECYEIVPARRTTIGTIAAQPGVTRLIVMHFLVFLAFNFFYIAFPVYAVNGLEWSLAETGVFFSVMGLMMSVVQGPVLARASRRWSNEALILTGGLLLAMSFSFFASEHTAVIYAGTAFLAVGNGLMWPSLLAALSRATKPEFQGAVQGFAGSAGAIASITGLLVGGVLYAVIGPGIFFASTAITALVVSLAAARPAAMV